MQNAIAKTLEHSKNIIISPDIDGFMSAELLNRKYGSVVVGTYDKNILTLSDDIDPAECLFVDCDMNTKNFVSIGNHMRLQEDNMADKSFNPNRFFGTSVYWKKFPYATCFLISATIEVDLDTYDLKRMAHADSTLINMIKYGDNMRSWSSRLRLSDIEGILDQSIDITDIQTKYPTQSFTSKRFGKERYINTLNESLEREGLAFREIVGGKKYLADMIGKPTIMRYNQDIISYAEVYTGEYSVTYDQEIEFR